MFEESSIIKRTKTNGLFCNQVRKEKLGDRVTALQQLVSPFGKVNFWILLFHLFGYIYKGLI